MDVLSRLRGVEMSNSFHSAKSVFAIPGPLSEPTPALPKWYKAGIAKQAGLYHSCRFCPPGTLRGSQPWILSALWLKSALRVELELIFVVKEPPELRRAATFNCQPPR